MPGGVAGEQLAAAPYADHGSDTDMLGRALQLLRKKRPWGSYFIPDCWESFILEIELTKDELSFANAVEQYDSGNGGGCAIKVLEAEHRPCFGFDPR